MQKKENRTAFKQVKPYSQQKKMIQKEMFKISLYKLIPRSDLESKNIIEVKPMWRKIVATYRVYGWQSRWTKSH